MEQMLSGKQKEYCSGRWALQPPHHTLWIAVTTHALNTRCHQDYNPNRDMRSHEEQWLYLRNFLQTERVFFFPPFVPSFRMCNYIRSSIFPLNGRRFWREFFKRRKTNSKNSKWGKEKVVANRQKTVGL